MTVTVHADVAANLQKLTPPEIVELFVLDLNTIGINEIYRFTSVPFDKTGASVSFGGNPYYPVNMMSEGWEFTGSGPFPQPKLVISNVFSFLSTALVEAKDLVGAKLTRTRTYPEYLDTGSDPDTTKILPQDTYYVHQKSAEDETMIEFTLAAAMDQQGLMLPRRKILRDVCTHSYRKWTGSAFNYDKATCPYNKNKYFDIDNNSVTDPALDNCSRELTGCIFRFKKEPLPTRAFPGIIRIRTD